MSSQLADPAGGRGRTFSPGGLVLRISGRLHLYDFSRPEVADQWGTANTMNELVARQSFNDVDAGLFIPPPI
jgi:hypothetical protein